MVIRCDTANPIACIELQARLPLPSRKRSPVSLPRAMSICWVVVV